LRNLCRDICLRFSTAVPPGKLFCLYVQTPVLAACLRSRYPLYFAGLPPLPRWFTRAGGRATFSPSFYTDLTLPGRRWRLRITSPPSQIRHIFPTWLFPQPLFHTLLLLPCCVGFLVAFCCRSIRARCRTVMARCLFTMVVRRYRFSSYCADAYVGYSVPTFPVCAVVLQVLRLPHEPTRCCWFWAGTLGCARSVHTAAYRGFAHRPFCIPCAYSGAAICLCSVVLPSAHLGWAVLLCALLLPASCKPAFITCLVVLPPITADACRFWAFCSWTLFHCMNVPYHPPSTYHHYHHYPATLFPVPHIPAAAATSCLHLAACSCYSTFLYVHATFRLLCTCNWLRWFNVLVRYVLITTSCAPSFTWFSICYLAHPVVYCRRFVWRDFLLCRCISVCRNGFRCSSPPPPPPPLLAGAGLRSLHAGAASRRIWPRALHALLASSQTCAGICAWYRWWTRTYAVLARLPPPRYFCRAATAAVLRDVLRQKLKHYPDRR